MYLRQISPPAAELITLDEAKRYLRVESDFAADDVLIADLVTAARVELEELTRRQFVAATWDYAFDEFPYGRGDERHLPRPPLLGVDSIQYYDVSGVVQLLPATKYDVDIASEPGRFHLAFAQFWPATRPRINAVTCRYKCGYVAPFTADATADTITLSGWMPNEGDPIQFMNAGETGAETATAYALPAPLVENLLYYALNVAGQTCQVAATSGGAAINLTTAGGGVHFCGPTNLGELKLIRQAMRAILTDAYDNRSEHLGLRVEANETVQRVIRLLRTQHEWDD